MRFASFFILSPKILCQWAFEGVPGHYSNAFGCIVLSAILSFKTGCSFHVGLVWQ